MFYRSLQKVYLSIAISWLIYLRGTLGYHRYYGMERYRRYNYPNDYPPMNYPGHSSYPYDYQPPYRNQNNPYQNDYPLPISYPPYPGNYPISYPQYYQPSYRPYYNPYQMNPNMQPQHHNPYQVPYPAPYPMPNNYPFPVNPSHHPNQVPQPQPAPTAQVPSPTHQVNQQPNTPQVASQIPPAAPLMPEKSSRMADPRFAPENGIPTVSARYLIPGQADNLDGYWTKVTCPWKTFEGDSFCDEGCLGYFYSGQCALKAAVEENDSTPIGYCYCLKNRNIFFP